MGTVAYRPGCRRPDKKEISWSAVRYHFCKWSEAGRLERVWQHSIQVVRDELHQLNLDGSHTIAKKGG